MKTNFKIGDTVYIILDYDIKPGTISSGYTDDGMGYECRIVQFENGFSIRFRLNDIYIDLEEAKIELLKTMEQDLPNLLAYYKTLGEKIERIKLKLNENK